jgi:hypothetical protein
MRAERLERRQRQPGLPEVILYLTLALLMASAVGFLVWAVAAVPIR